MKTVSLRLQDEQANKLKAIAHTLSLQSTSNISVSDLIRTALENKFPELIPQNGQKNGQ